jgi:5-formyltetrahydrofolate cyclo-ligase
VAGRPSRQANPDKAQRAVRAKALAAGKLLDMAVPRLADDLPFYLLDPEDLRGSPWEAASQGGRCQGRPEVAATQLRPVDPVLAALAAQR